MKQRIADRLIKTAATVGITAGGMTIAASMAGSRLVVPALALSAFCLVSMALLIVWNT